MADLRDWIREMQATGKLREINGVDWNLELAAVHFVNRQLKDPPALIFNRIKGYPEGYRVLAGALNSPVGVAKSIGLKQGPEEISDGYLLEYFRKRLGQWKRSWQSFAPVQVDNGPVMEEIHEKQDVNLWEFPSPKWFPLDGGRYIGTDDAVITRDPDTGEINLGAYRMQVYDERTLGLYIEQGKHGRLHYEKYLASGKPCPIAVSFGHHPIIHAVASLPLPFGAEYGYIGAILGEAVRVIKEEITGLPIPADSEIVVAGWVPPGETRVEGPFGEWTGYYASGARPAPVVKVERVYHRKAPIIMGLDRAGRPPLDYFGTLAERAVLYNDLLEKGVPDVQGVWVSDAAGPMLVVVSIRQRYAGHSKEAGLAAFHSARLAKMGRYTIVVDDDIDPTNINDVLWALCFRSDPERDIDVIRNTRSMLLDPLIESTSTAPLGSRAIIDACKPYDRLTTFAQTVKPDAEIIERVKRKFFA